MITIIDMKYNLSRQIFIQDQEVQKAISKEAEAQKEEIFKPTTQNLKEIAEVCSAIEAKGLPDYLIIKKLPHDLGHGLFLRPNAKPLKKGTVIAPYSGEVELIAHSDERDSAYMFAIFTELTLDKPSQQAINPKAKFSPRRLYALNLDAEKKGNFTRFINHSSLEPNVEAKLLRIGKNKLGLKEMPVEVVYFAQKTIKPGEQLLVCYEDEDETYWSAVGITPYPMDPKTFKINSKLELVES